MPPVSLSSGEKETNSLRANTIRCHVPRRPAQITQADVARIIRAAKQAGAAEVEVMAGNQRIIVRFQFKAQEIALASDEEIVL